MRLSTKARYAVMAMVDIAYHGDHYAITKPVSLSAIAERQGLPLPYLEQLFNKLKNAQLVASSRGAAGGYTLNRSATHISIFDIISAVDLPLKATRCDAESSKGCQSKGDRCLTHDLWDELTIVVQSYLKQVSLSDVCENRVRGLAEKIIFPLSHALSSSLLINPISLGQGA